MNSTFVFGWGNVGDGQLGLGGIEEEQIYSPREIALLTDKRILDVASSFSHTLFLTEDGVLYSCGNNDHRQLGHELPRKRPERISVLETSVVTQAKCGTSHSVALTNQGQVITWGSNEHHQLGRVVSSALSTPKPVKFPSLGVTVVQISCGCSHNVALADDGSVFTWGSNDCGQLGIGTPKEAVDVFEPQRVASLAGMVTLRIASGANHNFVLTETGALLGWGDNKFGQLGVGDQLNRWTPEACRTLRTQDIKYVCCGDNHTAVLTHNGGVFTFGAGMYGQLGHGNTNSETNPKKVFELMGDVVTMVTCGRNHTLAYIKSKNRLYAFGLGSNGQLGLGTRSNFHIPTNVKLPSKSSSSFVRSIHAGGDQTFVVLSIDAKAYPQLDYRKIFRHQQIDTITMDFVDAISSCSNVTEVLERRMEKLFSSLSCINGSFLKKEDPQHCDVKNHGVDISASQKAFQLISKPACKLSKDLIDGFVEKRLVQDFPDKLLDMEGLRFFMLLPTTHYFSEPGNYAYSVLCPLLRHLLTLDRHHGKVLEGWWMQAGTNYIVNLVKSLKELVCRVIEQQKDKKIFAGHCLFVGLEVLKKLHQLSFQAVDGSNLPIEHDLFYISGLHDLVQLELDYIFWFVKGDFPKHLISIVPVNFEKVEVPFCTYPFIFDAQAKTILLRTDAQLQMKTAVDQAHIQNLASFFSNSGISDPELILLVSRENIVRDTIEQLMLHRDGDYKKPLRVKFLGEGAVDAGGVKKEFFMLLLKDLLDPKYGMFRYFEESRLIWINPDTFELESMYHLVGVVCGLAIYNDNIISMNLPLVLFKKLLMKPANLEDLKELEPTMGRSLQSLLEYDNNDIEDTFNLTFEITRDVYGKLVTIPLVPGGSEKVVNRLNRSEYVDVYVNYVFNESVKVQFNAFRDGFLKVCGGKILELFQPKELQAMVVGNENYDWDELQKNAKYLNYTADHGTVKMFWEVFKELTAEDKKKFLMFLTGCDRIPILGMKAIQIKIQNMGNDQNLLPVAHTCFNILDLPEYKSKETLRTKLLQAIEHTHGFGLA